MIGLRPMEQRSGREQSVTVDLPVGLFCKRFDTDDVIDTEWIVGTDRVIGTGWTFGTGLVIESGIRFGSDFVFCVADVLIGTYGVIDSCFS